MPSVPNFARLQAADVAMLDPTQQIAEIRPRRFRRHTKFQPRQGCVSRLSWGAAEFSFENPAETGSVCEAEILGNLRNRLYLLGVG